MSQYRSSPTSSSTSHPGTFAVFLSLSVFALVVWALVCAGQLVAVTLAILFSGRSVFGIPGLATNIGESASFGGLGGLAIGMAAAWRDNERPHSGGVFWGAALSVGLVGLIVAMFAGAVGALGFPPSLSHSARAIFSADGVPVMVFIGGGIDGAGGAGFFSLVSLFIVVLLMIVALAMQIAIVLHLAYWVVATRSKGATASYFGDLIRTRAPAISQPAEKLRPVVVGMQRGLVAGVCLGLCEATFTTWGAAVLVHG